VHEGDDVIAGSAGSRRVGGGVALAAGALLALGGCAAGQHAQTAEETPVVDGVAANAGPIALRAVTIAAPTDKSYAKGSDATLQLVIVNGSRTDDQLTGVTTPVAAEVRLFANAVDATATPLATPSGSPSTTGSVKPSGTGSTNGSSPTPTASALPVLSSINLPAGRAVSFGYTPDLPVIQLQDLTKQLFPAQAFPITFQFAKAGAVTFTVAVHLASGPATTPSIDIKRTAES